MRSYTQLTRETTISDYFLESLEYLIHLSPYANVLLSCEDAYHQT